MRPIPWSEFEDRLEDAGRAFHLELRDAYNVVSEREPFRRWRAGLPDDFAWRRDWLSFVRYATGKGVQIQRVRLASEQLSDYARWAISLDPQNIGAGEDIRYLPYRFSGDIAFPAEDFWLFDDTELLWSLFKPDGSSGGFAVEDDPQTVTRCRLVRDQVWSRAIPYAQYVAN